MWWLIIGAVVIIVAALIVRAVGGEKGQKKLEKIAVYISLPALIVLALLALLFGSCDMWRIIGY